MAKDKKVPALWAFSKDKFTYDTVQDMKNDTGLSDGVVVTCTGIENKNDGRNTQFIIQPAGTAVNSPDFVLNNGKVAKYIPQSEIQFRWINNNEDLNNFKSSGRFAKTQPDVVVINQPFASAFYLEAQDLELNGKYIIQKATSFSTTEVASRSFDITTGWTAWVYSLPGKILQQYTAVINTPALELSVCRKIGVYKINNFNTVFPGNEFQDIYQHGILEVFQLTRIIQIYRPDNVSTSPNSMWVLKRDIDPSFTLGTGWALENAAYLI